MINFSLPMIIPVQSMLAAYDKIKTCKDKLQF